MNNNGTKVWNSDATPHRLGSRNPQDNMRWWLGRVGLPWEPVNPTQSVTFNFNATAPSSPGTYPFDWKMVEDGIEWFGATCQKNINVVNPPPNGEIRGKVCKDDNGNGTCDSGEVYLRDPSLSGCPNPSYSQSITITYSGPSSGSAILNQCSSITNDPIYSVTGLPAGTYTVTTSIPSGWQNTGLNPQIVVVPAGGSVVAAFYLRPSLPGNFSLSLGGPVACNYVPLSWTSSLNADGYRILRGSPRVDITPYPYTALNFTDYNVSQNTTYPYQIEAYNSAGTNRSNTINVTTPYCPPVVRIDSNPSSIFQGQSSTLTWTTYYASSCSASGAWSGSKAINSGSETVIPLPPPSVIYTLTCSGLGGSSSDSEIINITSLASPIWREVIPR